MTGSILVVDDQAQNRLLVEAQLAAEGYDVLLAESGGEALALLEARAGVDLILLDVMMPVMDGFETCRRIRERATTSAIPVLFLTASHETTVHQQALASGGDDFLQKPIERTELIMRVRSLIRVARLRRQRDQLLGLLVHDLKSPLSGIVLNAEFALEETSGAARDAIGDVLSAADRMQRMIHDWIDLGRAEDGTLTAALATVPLDAMLSALERDCRRALELRRQRLVVGERAPLVRADEALLTRTLQNLVDNAIRSTPRDGTITIDFERAGEHARLRVRDEGPGVPEADRAGIFEKFAPVQGPQNARTSRNIGLSFCRLAAEAQGGRIWVEPNAPRGSMFILELRAIA
ncbi:MAG: response regulator [Labilithrix sp.]